MKIFINEYKYDERLKKIIPADVNKNQTDVHPWRLKAFVVLFLNLCISKLSRLTYIDSFIEYF